VIKQILVTLSLLCFSVACHAGGWYGSGFFINDEGYIATAGHVVQNSKQLLVDYKGKLYKADIVATDYVNDTAIIHIQVQNNAFFPMAKEIHQGETIYVMGYPLPEELGIDLKISQGTILFVGDQIEMSASTCAGNSGGAVVNDSNQVVGILVSGVPMFHQGRCSWLTQSENNKHLIRLADKHGVRIIVSDFRTGSQTRDETGKQAAKDKSVVIIYGSDE
jgi:hypothetical protein